MILFWIPVPYGGAKATMATSREIQQRCQTPGQGTAPTTADAQGLVLSEAGTTHLANQGLLGAVLLNRMPVS